MYVSSENGKLCLRLTDGRLFASDLTARVDYTGPYTNTLHLEAMGEWVYEKGIARCENAEMEFLPKGQGMCIRTRFTNTQPDIPAINAFNALVLSLADLPRRGLITRPHQENGNQHGGMQSAAETLPLLWGSRVLSADFAAVECQNSNALFGFVTAKEFFSLWEIAGDGVFSARQLTEKHPLLQGQTLVSDWIYLSPCGEIRQALPEYARQIAGFSSVSEKQFPVPVGFCSWYYYLGDVTDNDISENVHWFSCHKSQYPVSVMQIDAGWYKDWGDWEANDAFRGDMKGLADSIRAEGYIPGLWFCPFGATENSRVFREHPEYFVKRADGSLWVNKSGKYCFDFSREDVCDHMRRIVTRFTKQWGYGYLKMDIISDVLAPGVHRDPSFNSLKNYRRGLEVVREAAGDEVFLLGCTTPMIPSAGLVDGMRVSGDIFDHWECLPRIFARVFKRWWMHGILYCNDADCLILRTSEEEDEKCRRPCSRTRDELQTFVTAMVASGGALMFSDKMALLKDWQHELFSYCFPLNTIPAVPLDLMDADHPGILDFGIRNGARTVALINWENRPCIFTVPGSADHLIFEFWKKEFRGLAKTDLRETVEPHGCRVFQMVLPKDRTVAGTDSSLLLDISALNGEYKKNKPEEKLLIAEKTDAGFVCHWE